MVTTLQAVFTAILKLILVAGLLLYAGLVFVSYRTEGPYTPLKLDAGDPARSLERLFVWLGVRAVAMMRKLGVVIFNMLAEASAEVGEWFIRRRSPQVQEAIRSRFRV